MVRRPSLLSILFAIVLTQTPSAQTAPPAAPHVSFSGYLQPQYEMRSHGDETSDRLLFRRMVLGLETTLPRSWSTQLQVDFGPVASSPDGRLIVKDAYVRYTAAGRIVLTIGNQKVPFSRSLLTSSSRRSLVERPIAGDRSFGSPGRAIGVFADAWHRGRTIHWTAGAAYSQQSPDPDEVRVDGPAEARSGWNKGPLLSGRIELHPIGDVPRSQGDFAHGRLAFTAAMGAYTWSNRDQATSSATGFVNANRVSGLEISGAVRGFGLSTDVEFEHIMSDAVDENPDLGLYVDGRAVIDKASLETGYMLLPKRLEALVGFDATASDAFDATWRRVNTGMNWYMNGHRLKVSLMHRQSFNDRGTRNERSRATYLQTQFSF